MNKIRLVAGAALALVIAGTTGAVIVVSQLTVRPAPDEPEPSPPVASTEPAEPAPDTGTPVAAGPTKPSPEAETFTAWCGVCHTLGEIPVNGPRAVEIAEGYRARYDDEQAFVDAVLRYLAEPSAQATLMPEAVKTWNLMPTLAYTDDVRTSGARFLWGLSEGAQPQVAEPSTADLTGAELFTLRCGTCHPSDPPPTNGPPARGINRAYTGKYPDVEGFKSAIVSFVTEPTEDKSIMAPPLQRFGLMPQLQWDEDELDRIAGYLYGIRRGRGQGTRGQGHGQGRGKRWRGGGSG